MPRNSERSFCCGAGGARMWMEETIGERINVNRTTEAVATGADQIAVGCPFCRVMLSDGLTAAQAKGDGPRGGRGPRRRADAARVGQGRESVCRRRTARGEVRVRVPRHRQPTTADRGDQGRARGRRRHPDRGHGHRDRGRRRGREAASGGGSLFDLGDDEADAPEPEKPAAAAAGGGSLFDLGDDEPEAAPEPAAAAAGGGSLFDLGDDEEEAAPEPEPPAAAGGGSLFDLGDDEDDAPAEQAAGPTAGTEEQRAEAKPAATVPASGSLFDIEEPDEPQPASAEAGEDPGRRLHHRRRHRPRRRPR